MKSIIIITSSLLILSTIAQADNNSTGDVTVINEDHEAAVIKAKAAAHKIESEAEANERKYWQEFTERRLAFDDKVSAGLLEACRRQNALHDRQKLQEEEQPLPQPPPIANK